MQGSLGYGTYPLLEIKHYRGDDALGALLDHPAQGELGRAGHVVRLSLGGTTCLSYSSITTSCVSYGRTRLMRLIEFAARFATFEEHMR